MRYLRYQYLISDASPLYDEGWHDSSSYLEKEEYKFQFLELPYILRFDLPDIEYSMKILSNAHYMLLKNLKQVPYMAHAV